MERDHRASNAQRLAYRDPCIVGRVFLRGDYDQRIVLFKSVLTGEIKPFAGEIAEFLKFPLVSDE